MKYLLLFDQYVKGEKLTQCQTGDHLTELVTMSHGVHCKNSRFYRLVNMDANISIKETVKYFRIFYTEVTLPASITAEECTIDVEGCEEHSSLEELVDVVRANRHKDSEGYKAIVLRDAAIDAIELREYNGY